MDPNQPRQIGPRMTLSHASGHRISALPSSATLGAGPEALPPLPFSLFTPAEPPVELDVRPLPGATLGGPQEPYATLEYRPEEEAVYVALEQIMLPGGVLYNLHLPSAPSASATLSGSDAGVVRFELRPLRPPPGPPGPSGATLGLDDLVGSVIGDLVGKRVLVLLKSPIERGLLAALARAEGAPTALALRDTLVPLEGAEGWRTLLPPGAERRALLFLHGLASDTANGGGAELLPHLAAGYDALLGYNHPTLTQDPLANARDLLARIPDDVQLALDVVAHSRGGLVARCLAELAERRPNIRVRTLITCGTPHAGTKLANTAYWDQLISIGMTAATGLAAVSGVAILLPKVLEYLLKAAAQGILALPGIGALAPGSDLVKQLDSGDPARGAERYITVASNCTIFQPGLNLAEGLRSLAAQAFFDAPNDLVVQTSSMLASSRFPAEGQRRISGDHFSYFSDEADRELLRAALAGK
ncbi:MAG TPA: alpha/beta hydrolase [Roseiflexaceae bacterium]|nr:alpha/beta hydrolase [Roseiflexaceae bacterium]